MPINAHISHDFKSNKITSANVVERLGMFALKSAAWMTKPLRYVGFSKAAGLVRTFLPSKRSVQTKLLDDTVFEYPYGDSYWGRLAYNGDVYARAEEDFLMALRDVDYAYIDCGANFGYMSAIVTSEAYGKKPSIAIEADPDTFSILQQNCELNDNRFEIRHNAVFSKSGEMVNIHGNKHEARSILDEDGNRGDGNVETLALDDLQGWIKAQGKDKIILKLDVEGVEVDAMKGATKLSDQNLLVTYEDHGNDKSNEISQYFMQDLGMRIFASEEYGCRELTTLDEISAVKTNSRVGYDFIATKSDFWLEKVQNCKYE